MLHCRLLKDPTPRSQPLRQLHKSNVAPGSDQCHEEIDTSTVGGFGLLIRSTTGIPIPSPVCTRKLDEDFTDGISSPEWSERDSSGGGGRRRRRQGRRAEERKNKLRRFCLRLDFLLYDVASLLRLDVHLLVLATAGLKPSADYDDVTDDVINAKPSADSSARRRFISFTSLLIC
ncbi:hypothetical protein F511_19469 [Dorcoceras hygrometricum]|uniref:Uncharacterized protein n=1 Tax=Dorcoceras hygrometricum TaxID=472368 RepID=A0A2Z7DK55_9LAMI|nr:hypothetical protein F511_19469 [Dorcoceras hygrometricum]